MLIFTAVSLSLLLVGKTLVFVTCVQNEAQKDKVNTKIESYLDVNSTASKQGIGINNTSTLENVTMENSSVLIQSTDFSSIILSTERKQKISSPANVNIKQTTSINLTDSNKKKTTLKSTLFATKTASTKKLKIMLHKEKVKTKQEMDMMNAVAMLILFGGTFILTGIAILSSFLDAPKTDIKKEKKEVNENIPKL